MKINRRSLLINLSLFIVSALVGLLLSEMALRLLGYEPLYVSPERDRFWMYDARLGWAHKPGQEGVFSTQQFRTRVRINETGLRDRSHSYERQNDTKRILVLGDSFAWGYGVEESERFSQLLEGTMGVEVINAGVSGYSTDQELLWYQNEGIKYDTDLVILVLTGNDVGDNDRELVNNIYYKPKFIIEDGKLVATGYPVPKTSSQGKIIYALSQRSALAYFLVLRYFDLLNLYGKMRSSSDQTSTPASSNEIEREPFQLTIALIEEMQNIAKSKNAKFMIVSTDRWWNLPADDATYADLVSAMRSEGLLVLDVESLPGFDPEQMLIPDDGHWNREGHHFVSDRIKEFIESNKLINSGLAR